MKIEELVMSGVRKSEVARICGVSRQAVSQWDEIPKKHESKLTDAQRNELRLQMMEQECEKEISEEYERRIMKSEVGRPSIDSNKPKKDCRKIDVEDLLRESRKDLEKWLEVLVAELPDAELAALTYMANKLADYRKEED